MKLTTKNRLFKELSTLSLFCSGRTFTVEELKNLGSFKYDLGKYNPSIKDIDMTNVIYPVWYELRKDKDGRYLQLMTFNTNSVQLETIWKIYKNNNKEV